MCYEHEGEAERVAADHVIDAAIDDYARFLGLDIPLTFQKVDAVYLLIDKPFMTRNHWLYFMDRSSTINRIVEFKQMSPEDTVPDRTVVCAEVTRNVDDPVGAVIADLVQSGVIKADEVLDTKVIHEPFAYPRYTRCIPARLRHSSNTSEHSIIKTSTFLAVRHAEVDDLIGVAHDFVTQFVGATPETVSDADSQPPLVTIVVLTWNNYADTAECLASLQRLTYKHYNIVVVDNGSSDDTPAKIWAAFPEVVVLENGANLGVPAGYNVGFRYVLEHGADHVFMLNNDTIVDPAILDHLVTAAREPDAGILHPVVYFYNERDQIWSAGARYRAFPPAIVMELRLFPTAHGYHDLEYAISCGLLITRSAFEKVGLFY